MEYGNSVELIPAGTVITAGANGEVVLDTINKSTLRAVVDVSAVSGTSTPTITFTVQTSADKGVTDSWRDVAAFSGITATGKSRKAFPGLDRYTRIKWAVTGTTPSFTLGVTGEVV